MTVDTTSPNEQDLGLPKAEMESDETVSRQLVELGNGT